MEKLKRVHLTKLGSDNNFTTEMLESVVGQIMSSFFTDCIITARSLFETIHYYKQFYHLDWIIMYDILWGKAKKLNNKKQPFVDYYDRDYLLTIVNTASAGGAFLNEMKKVDLFTFDFEFSLIHKTIEIAQIATANCVYLIRFKQAILFDINNKLEFYKLFIGAKWKKYGFGIENDMAKLTALVPDQLNEAWNGLCLHPKEHNL